ncbi:unnamed protein product [Malus baccata var. baccata]
MQSSGYNGGRGSGVPDFYPNGRSISFAAAMNDHPYSSYPTYTQPQGPYSSPLRLRRLHHVPDFRLDSFSLTNFNVSLSRSLSDKWFVGFSFYNPNKKLSFRYEEVVSSIFYQNDFISETRVQPFAKGKKDRNLINATLSAVNSFGDARVVRGIEVDRGRKTVSFNVKVLARVQFQNGWWRLRQRLLRVLCCGVAVSVSSNSGSGKLASGSRDCQVAV